MTAWKTGMTAVTTDSIGSIDESINKVSAGGTIAASTGTWSASIMVSMIGWRGATVASTIAIGIAGAPMTAIVITTTTTTTTIEGVA